MAYKQTIDYLIREQNITHTIEEIILNLIDNSELTTFENNLFAGIGYLVLNKFREAIKLFDQTPEDHYLFTKTQFYKGLANKLNDKAIQTFTQTLEDDGNHKQANLELEFCLEKLQPQKARNIVKSPRIITRKDLNLSNYLQDKNKNFERS